MNIKIIKSHDQWEEDCSGWYDLYQVDEYFIYPLSDWWENDPVPQDVLDAFKETLNGSKIRYCDVIKALYWDLVLSEDNNGVCFDDWLDEVWGKSVAWMEKDLRDSFDVVIEVVGHDVAYSDMIMVQEGRYNK